MRIKPKDILHFGIDTIELIGRGEAVEDINFGLSSEEFICLPNFPDFKLKKTFKVNSYEYKIVFRKKGFDCFAFHKGQLNGVIKTYDYFSVYGSAFRIYDSVEEILVFIQKYFYIERIRRFDVAMDIPFSVIDIHKKFKKLNQKGSKFYDEKGELQTFYIGEKQKSKNKYKLFRCYNKKDDVLRTKKQSLYSDYLKKDFVSRLEFEFRSELCARVTLENLLDRDYLLSLFLTYIEKHTSIFSGFDYEAEKLNVFKKRVSLDELQTDEILKRRYVNIFIGYGKTILEIGGCPVDILLKEGYISDDTQKDIVLSIKDGKFRQDIYEFGLSTRYVKRLFSDGEDDDVVYLSNQSEND